MREGDRARAATAAEGQANRAAASVEAERRRALEGGEDDGTEEGR
jgi:hypothetical protein